MIHFVIPVEPRTKKNNQQMISVRGRIIPIPSKQYLEFEKKCLPYLPRTESIYYPVNVKATYYMQAKRKVDLSNLNSALDDVLVKAGVIEDDNRDIIAGHDGSRVFYDKLNPRIEVIITKEENYLQWKDRTINQIGLNL